jgi:hypothetical protein
MRLTTSAALAFLGARGVGAFEQAVDKYSVHQGHISGNLEDILVADLTPADARLKCAALPRCKGFTFKGEKADKVASIHFKAGFEFVSGTGEDGWYSYQRTGLYSKHKGHVSGSVPDILQENILLSEAEARCDAIPNCHSFCYRSAGESAAPGPVEVHFKGSTDVIYDEDNGDTDWITHRRMTLYSVHPGHVSGRYPDIEMGQYSIEQAQEKCLTIRGCRGFTFEGPVADLQQQIMVHFKAHVDVQHGDGSETDKWVTYRRMGLFTKHYGHIAGSSPDLAQETLTIHDAQVKCLSMSECRGFTFNGRVTEDPTLIYFKSNAVIDESDGEDSPWTSFRRQGLYSHMKGHISGTARTLLIEKMTKPEAVAKCDALESCRGFTYERNQGFRVYNSEGQEASELEFTFKDRADWHRFDPNSDWDSWHRDDLGFMSQAEEKLQPSTSRKFLQPLARKPENVGDVAFESTSVSEF